MYRKQAEFRFYEELNDHLPKELRKKTFTYNFNGSQTVKDAIESLRVPHVEVDLILINSRPVDFKYRLQHDDKVSVYPVFELFDISKVSSLRKKGLRYPKFILDVHLGKLARYLRLMGFDTLYRNDYSDREIIEISVSNNRIILTRDIGILKNDKVTRGYWLRSQDSKQQLCEVLKKFDLYSQIQTFSRCIVCNGIIESIGKDKIADKITPNTFKYYNEFFKCSSCQRLYWEGSHYIKLKKFTETIFL